MGKQVKANKKMRTKWLIWRITPNWLLSNWDIGSLLLQTQTETLAFPGPEGNWPSDQNITISFPGLQVFRLHPVEDAGSPVDSPCRSWHLLTSIIMWKSSSIIPCNKSIKQSISSCILSFFWRILTAADTLVLFHLFSTETRVSFVQFTNYNYPLTWQITN